MPSQLSVAAKTTVAVGTSVILAGITAWQIATRDGFTWWDLIPVVAAVAGIACTDHVENTLRHPVAKAVVHGSLSAVAAVAAALTAVVGTEPTGVSAAKLLTVALGALLVWWVPEAGPVVRVIDGELAQGAPAAQVLATVAADVSASMGPDLPDAAPSSPAEPTPIADQTRAALTDTAPLPTVTA